MIRFKKTEDTPPASVSSKTGAAKPEKLDKSVAKKKRAGADVEGNSTSDKDDADRLL